jgi:LacI family transcriptional regulator
MDKYKEVTIYDIAKELKISAATVSRGLKDHPAINKTTKKKILETAKRMGYRSNNFARNLRRQSTNTIGVIVPRLNSNLMADAIAGIEKIVSEAGYSLLISQSFESEEKEIANAHTMFNSRVDGLIVSLSFDTKDISHFEPFLHKKIPLIFFDRVYNLQKTSSIVIDNFKAAYEITSHLIEQGCKNIIHITGNPVQNVYKDRLKGFRKALADHKISYGPGNLLLNDLSISAGVEAAKQLIKMRVLPDAVFVANDICAVSCMLELKKNKIHIPKNILFAGFNNDPISSVVEPNLTTVDYKGFEMGEITAKTLLAHLNQPLQPSYTQNIIMPHELIVRQSSQK